MSEQETDFIEDSLEWLAFLAGWLHAQRAAGVPYASSTIQRARAAWHEYQDEIARARARRLVVKAHERGPWASFDGHCRACGTMLGQCTANPDGAAYHHNARPGVPHKPGDWTYGFGLDAQPMERQPE